MEETVYKRSDEGKKIAKVKRSNQYLLKYMNNQVVVMRKIYIGRDMKCDIVLDDPLVSRRHALLEQIGEGLVIRDLKSTNCTYVNNDPLQRNEKRYLSAGDEIRIGNTKFTINAFESKSPEKIN